MKIRLLEIALFFITVYVFHACCKDETLYKICTVHSLYIHLFFAL